MTNLVEVYNREYRWAAAAALELWRRAGALFLLVNLAPWVFFL